MDLEKRLEKIKEVPTAWTDHIYFAQWIVNELNPDVIVDLGIDYGYSTYCFALAEKGTIYAVDSFEGDSQSGIRNTLKYVNLKIKQLEYKNIKVIQGNFDAVVKDWDKDIDILHIDGYHTYEAVKNDYEKWSPFVKENGIILFHDTCILHSTFGVHKFFHELDLPKINFKTSCGLGVVSQDSEILEKIKEKFKVK